MSLDKILELLFANPGGGTLIVMIVGVLTWNVVTTYHLVTKTVTKKDMQLALSDFKDQLENNGFVSSKVCTLRHEEIKRIEESVERALTEMKRSVQSMMLRQIDNRAHAPDDSR